jgi:propanol-preferring alcohol dehydrogenase
MKAMVLAQGANRLRDEEVESVHPKPGELLVEVEACAVCRTDLQLVRGDIEARSLPLVPGHQIVGRVVEVGRDVRDWRPGESACSGWLAGTCGLCDYCRAGRENLCPDARFRGWSDPGGFAEFVCLRSDFAYRLPEGFSRVEAAPLLCGGVIGYRSLKRSGVHPGERLGLFGFGASARITIQVALAWGCRVFVWTRSEREQGSALEQGADWAGPYDAEPPAQIDAAVTFAPAGAVVVRALECLRPGGTVAINAIHLDGVPAFNYDLMWLERGIVSVANYTRQDAAELLDLAARIPIRTATRTFALADANVALDMLEAGTLAETAVLVP